MCSLQPSRTSYNSHFNTDNTLKLHNNYKDLEFQLKLKSVFKVTICTVGQSVGKQ